MRTDRAVALCALALHYGNAMDNRSCISSISHTATHIWVPAYSQPLRLLKRMMYYSIGEIGLFFPTPIGPFYPANIGPFYPTLKWPFLPDSNNS